MLEQSVLDVKSKDDLQSPLLGASSDLACGTCFLNSNECPGHWGTYRFSRLYVHPLRFSEVKKQVSGLRVKKNILQKKDLSGKWQVYLPDTKCSGCISVLPISPLCVRPDCMSDRGLSLNDLTHRLGQIITLDQKADTILIQRRVQTSLTQLFFPQSESCKDLSTYSARFKGKNGRLRRTCLGKRLDFSAR